MDIDEEITGPASIQDDDVDMDIDGEASHEPASSAPVKLEELLLDNDNDDDGDDDKLRTWGVKHESTAVPSSPPAVAPASIPTAGFDASDHAVMRSFYQRLFPWQGLFRWLNHGPVPSKDFSHREFAFTLQNDAHLRYQSFPTGDLLRKDVLAKMPTRFDIGPVYSAKPRDRKMFANTSAFRPVAKELCFDIDLTDYDDVRTCCDKANICARCWRFISLAIRVLDRALRDDFGFAHILWVYSGRRGAHAWVCDQKARVMNDKERRAIVGYFEVVRGGAQGGKKVNLRRPLHPHLSRSLNILKDHFQEDVLENQDPWQSAEGAEKLLALLPDQTLNKALRQKWEASPGRSSTAKWADIDAVARTGASRSLDARALLEAKQDVVLEYTYPRLDVEVSKKLNHLLKSPFVVHPGTGRVCVPIMVDTAAADGPAGIDEFDPLAVPTVQALLEEVDAWRLADGQDEDDKNAASTTARVLDWEKTSLRPYIQYFRAFVAALNKDEPGAKVKEESIDF